MNCCQHERITISPLPFEKIIYLDFYDGPLAGYTMCSICHKCFHFKVLQWDSHIFCRVFGFAPIEMNFDRVDKDIKQWTENTILVHDERRKTGNDDIPIPETTEYVKQIEQIALQLEFSYICITPSYLDKGYWRKMEEADKNITANCMDWFEHLGVVYDYGNLAFHLKKFHSL